MSDMYMSFSDAQFLLEDNYDAVIMEEDPLKYGFKEAFLVKKFERSVHVSYNVAGPGMPQERNMMEPLAPVSWKFGEPNITRPVLWGAQTGIPKELIRRLARLSERDAETAAQIGSYAEYLRTMKRQCNRRADVECATKLENGTSTAARFAGRYGEALFATTHTSLGNPSNSQSNLSPVLPPTEANLDAVIRALDSQVDDNGAPIALTDEWTIIAPLELRTVFWHILNTDKQVDTANNTKNRIASMKDKFTLVTWRELTSATKWAVFAKGHKVWWRWEEEPYFDKDSDVSTNSLSYAVNMSGATGHDTWLNTYGVGF